MLESPSSSDRRALPVRPGHRRVHGLAESQRTFELSQDGQSFTGGAQATTYDAVGNMTETFAVQTAAQRMQVERAPAQP
jgi:hypothetical protein